MRPTGADGEGEDVRKEGADGQERTLSVKAFGFARFPLLSLCDIFPRSGGSLSSRGELLSIFRSTAKKLPLSGELASHSDA